MSEGEELGWYLDALNGELRDAGEALLSMGFACDARIELSEGHRIWFKHQDTVFPLQEETWDFKPTLRPLLRAPWRVRVAAAHRLGDLLSALRVQQASDIIAAEEACAAAKQFVERCRG